MENFTKFFEPNKTASYKLSSSLDNRKSNSNNIFMKNYKLTTAWLFLVVTLFFGVAQAYSQLSDVQYLPPMRDGVANSASGEGNAIYLSTPETTPFNVNVFFGTATTPSFTITKFVKYNTASYGFVQHGCYGRHSAGRCCR